MSVVMNHPASLDVLIAEDDGDVRLAVRELLEGQGYTCAEAEDGGVAVEVARQRRPQLVLLDLMMPDVDGFAVAQQLRADPVTRGVRIHCLTALDFPAARKAAQQAGCDGFLGKPYAPEELLDTVSTAIYSLRPGAGVLARAVERLQQTLAAEVPGREFPWSQQLGSALVALDEALEGSAGSGETAHEVFARVDLLSPTLVRRAAALRRERYQLREQARALRAQAGHAAQAFHPAREQSGPAEAPTEPEAVGSVVDFSALRRSGEQLVADLLRHNAKERDVFFESFNTDIGVGD